MSAVKTIFFGKGYWFLFFAITACGGGGDSSGGSTNNNQQPPLTLSAFLTKGPISDAVCEAFKITSPGKQGVQIGSGRSQAGQVTFGSQIDHRGSAFLVCDGGTYEDEATGSILNAPRMRAVVRYTDSATFTISPLTELAVRGNEENLNNVSNTGIADLFGARSLDITNVQPTDIANDVAENTDAGRYGIILATISQMQKDSGLTITELLNTLAGDSEGLVFDDATNTLLTNALSNITRSRISGNLNNELIEQIIDEGSFGDSAFPVVELSANASAAQEGETVTITFSTTDNVAVIEESLSCNIPTDLLELGGNQFSFVAPEVDDLFIVTCTGSAFDANEHQTIETVRISVLNVLNTPPRIISVNGELISNLGVFEFSEADEFSFTIQAEDGDDDAISFSTPSVVDVSSFLSFQDNGDGSALLSFSPDFHSAGDYDVNINVTDGQDGVGISLRLSITQALSGAVNTIENGLFHSCVLNNGDVHCWGLGDALDTSFSSELRDVTHLAAGSFFTCAGGVFGVECWGNTDEGQKNIPSMEGSLIKLVAGHQHACALTTEDLYCWGGQSVFSGDNFGQELVPINLGNVLDVSTGHRHTCALLTDNSVECWGTNTFGESAPPTFAFTPTKIDLGRNRSCVTDGRNLACWGTSRLYTSKPAPSVIEGLQDFDIGNEGFSCAVANDALACWGDGGDNSESRNGLNRNQIPVNLGDIATMSVGNTHVCVVVLSGVECWGAGEQGANGDFDFGQSDVPVFLRGSQQ